MWIDRAARIVDPESSANRLNAVEPQELHRLRTACRPGQTLLGRDLTNGFEDTIKGLRQVAG